MESHRISSINYGKLARTITVELNLPVKDRGSGGAECVKTSRTEIDRLIEQSPAIPGNVLIKYANEFAGKGLSEPEIVVINSVDVYDDKENKIAETVSEAGLKFKSIVDKMKKPLFQISASNSPTERRKENVNKELNQLQSSKLVSMINTKTIPIIKTMLTNKKDKENNSVNTNFIEYREENINVIEPIEGKELTQESGEESGEESNKESGIIVDQVINDLIEDTVQTQGSVVDEIENLKIKGIVSSFSSFNKKS